MPGEKKLTHAQEVEITSKRAAGVSIEDLSIEYGVSKSTIKRAAAKHKVIVTSVPVAATVAPPTAPKTVAPKDWDEYRSMVKDLAVHVSSTANSLSNASSGLATQVEAAISSKAPLPTYVPEATRQLNSLVQSLKVLQGVGNELFGVYEIKEALYPPRVLTEREIARQKAIREQDEDLLDQLAGLKKL